MTFGLITLGLLTYAQNSGAQAATSAEGLGIGECPRLSLVRAWSGRQDRLERAEAGRGGRTQVVAGREEPRGGTVDTPADMTLVLHIHSPSTPL